VRIAVTGSIATDHLMTFPGRFVDQLIPDKLDKIALSFLVDSLQIRYGVDTSGVRESAVHHTGRFISTTDADLNHFASFYPGAMVEDTKIDLSDLTERVGPIDLVLIGASDPEAMSSFTRQCREHKIAFAADTSWQLARMEGEQVRDLVDGAAYLFCNEYEAKLTERKSGWADEEITARVAVRVTTLGADGARVDRAGEPPILVPPITGVTPKEPTGAGDGFRAGFLAAIAWGLGLERAAQLGNLMAVQALEAIGPQDYELKPGPLMERFAAVYGPEAAQDLAEHYS